MRKIYDCNQKDTVAVLLPPDPLMYSDANTVQLWMAAGKNALIWLCAREAIAQSFFPACTAHVKSGGCSPCLLFAPTDIELGAYGSCVFCVCVSQFI